MNTVQAPTEFNSPSPTPEPTNRRVWRIAAWIGGGLGLVVLVIALIVTASINSGAFHRYVIRVLEKQAGASLGVRVHLENFTLHLATLSVDLYGMSIDGASPYAKPPLLQVDHVEAGVRIVSVFRRKWYLDSFRIDHPVVQVFVDKNGVSNIPAVKSKGNTSNNTSIFDLGIRHAILDHGELVYNSQSAAISADVHNLDLDSTFNSLAQRYSGKLGYTDGRLQYGTLQPLPHNLDVEFDATPNDFHLTRARLVSGTSSAVISANLKNYASPTVDAHYDVVIDGTSVGQMLHNPSIPGGMIHTAGSAQYQQVPNQSLLQALVVNGSLASRELEVKTTSLRARINNLSGQYSLAKGNAVLHDLRAILLGGELTAQGTMNDIGGASHSNVGVALHGVSLAEMKRALGRSASTPGVELTGKLNATAAASWGRTLDDLVAHADATIAAQVMGGRGRVEQVADQALQPGSKVNPTAIPIDSAIHATYSGKNQQLALDKSFLRTPQTELTMNGAIGNRSGLALRLQARDLREVTQIADLFRSASPGKSLQPLGLSGSATFQGSVQGPILAPHLTGQLAVQNLQANGTTWKVLRTNVDLSPSQASLLHADLESASHGSVTFSASTGLNKWSFTNTSPLQLDLNASRLNLAEIAKLSGQQFPVTGTLNANVKLHGTELSPQGSGNVSLTGGTAYDEPFQSVKVSFSGTGDEAHADLSLQIPAGSLESKLNFRPKQKAYKVQVTSSGIDLTKVQTLKARNIGVTGTLSINANGQGTLDNPQLDATVKIPTLGLQNQTVSGLNLQMNVADHVANATLSSSAINTSIQAKAKVALSGDYLADVSLDTQAIPLQSLVAAYSPEQASNLSGQTEVHATLHGPLKNKKLLEGHVTIPVLKVAYSNNIQLAAVSPIRVDYTNGVINLQPAAIRGTDTDLQFQGSIPTTGNGPMSLRLLGTVNLQLAQLFDPDIRSSGQLKLNINSNGPRNDADLGGQIDIVDANFASGDLPVGLQHGNGVLTMTTDRVNIKSFQGAVGGGTVTAQGGVAYRGGIQFDLGLAARGIRVLYPQGMRESADADLRLTGSTDNAALGGSVNLSDLSFTPAFDLTSFVSQFSGGVVAPPSQGFSQNLALNIAVHSTNNVNLVSRTLSVGGSANLQVRGTAADPVLLGRVNLTGGDIILNGTRFVLTGGTVQFVNPSETQPVVRMTLTTTIQQYNIDLRFNGPADRLQTQYTADPALPQADIINLLAFGETTEAAANSPTTANQAAESLVASQVSSQVTSRVSKIAGISQLSINPVLAGSSSQGPPGANITIQQRVTGNLFITFSSNVASTQSQTIQGQYQVSPRVAVSATRDPNGGFALDALVKKSW